MAYQRAVARAREFNENTGHTEKFGRRSTQGYCSGSPLDQAGRSDEGSQNWSHLRRRTAKVLRPILGHGYVLQGEVVKRGFTPSQCPRLRMRPPAQNHIRFDQ